MHSLATHEWIASQSKPPQSTNWTQANPVATSGSTPPPPSSASALPPPLLTPSTDAHQKHTKYALHDELSSKSTASNSDEYGIISQMDHHTQLADAHLPPTTWPGPDGERVGCAPAARSVSDETPASQQYEIGSNNNAHDHHRDKDELSPSTDARLTTATS